MLINKPFFVQIYNPTKLQLIQCLSIKTPIYKVHQYHYNPPLDVTQQLPLRHKQPSTTNDIRHNLEVHQNIPFQPKCFRIPTKKSLSACNSYLTIAFGQDMINC